MLKKRDREKIKQMTWQNNWKSFILKIGIYGVLAVIALLIEILIFNYQPIFHKTEDIVIDKDYPENNEKYSISMEEKIIIIELAEPTYYRKLDMKFSKKHTCRYQITMEYENEFETLESRTVNERKAKGLKRGVTNLGEKISRIEIKILNEYKGNIINIKLTNHVQLNKYRCLLIFVLLATIAFFIMEKPLFKKRLEIVFFVLACAYSSMFCIAHGVQENGWDDDVHFKLCYYLSYGDEVPITKTVEDYIAKIPLNSYNTLEEKYLFEKLVDNNHNVETARMEAGIPFSYTHITYVLEILTMKLGRAMDMSFSQIYMFTKWVNMFTYILIMTLATAIAKKGKIYVTLLGLLPINLFVAGTITYNTQVFAFIILAIVLWMNEILESEVKLDKKMLLWSLVSFGIGASAKLIYAPLILMLGLLPKSKFKNENHKRIIIGIFVALCIIGIAIIAVPIIEKLFSGEIMPGDLRGGDTDIIRQLRSILMHPISYLLMFVKGVLENAGDFLLGRHGYVFFGRFDKLPYNFTYVTTVLILMVAFVQPRESAEVWLNNKEKIGMLFFVTLAVVLIWLSMYLAVTPVGTSTIKGVQARYYGVLLLPIFMICQNKRLLIDIKTETYHCCFIGVVAFLNLCALYYSIIEPWIL